VNEKYGRRAVREFWLAKDALLSIRGGTNTARSRLTLWGYAQQAIHKTLDTMLL